ncbi:MAG: Arm DNA-binding domain-containing protein [Thiotrichales bacterium]|nr:Arm DNA-binding domain-containing protein [Thiotrichales bacterium]
MPRRSTLRLTKCTVDPLEVEAKGTPFQDRNLAGFGVRVHATGRKLYVVRSRDPVGLKRVTLGRHRILATEAARKQAAVVIDRLERGESPTPAPPAPVAVADLAERFLTVEEYWRLGQVLNTAERDGSVWPLAIAALRRLVLTGRRHAEIVGIALG